MKQEKVENYPDLVRVDRGYLINTNDNLYRIARSRKQSNKKMKEMEDRLNDMDVKLNKILSLLQHKET